MQSRLLHRKMRIIWHSRLIHNASTHDRLYKNLDRIDTWLNTASNNGLFHKNTQKQMSYQEVQNLLDSARKELLVHNYFKCEYYISLSIDAYSTALYSAGRKWRFSNLYAGNVLVYLMGFLAGIFVFYYSGGYSAISNNLLKDVVGKEFYQTAIHATAWGCIGSILREFCVP